MRLNSRGSLLCTFALLAACQKQVVQTTVQSSTQACSSSISSLSMMAESLNPMSTKSFSTNMDDPSAKVRLDTASLVVPESDPSVEMFVDKAAGAFDHFSEFTLPSESTLVAVVDHECTKRLHHSLNPDLDNPDITISEVVMDESIVQVQNKIKGGKTLSHELTVTDDMSVEELEQLAHADPCLIMLSTSVKMKLSALPDDPYYDGVATPAIYKQKNLHLDAINYAAADDRLYVDGTKNITSDVVIAIIDSGVYLTHEDLAANLWQNDDVVGGGDNDGNGKIDDYNGWNFASNTNNPNPQAWSGADAGYEGHGTHVAGLAAAVRSNTKGGIGVMGVHGKIMALNVFGSVSESSTSAIDNAIRYAADEGAKVINMSLGGYGRSDSTGSAIAYAISKGAVVVAAAGNSNVLLTPSTFITPASFAAEQTGVISVGSFDSSTGNRSSFSNCSTTYVKIAAPGAYDSSQTSTGGLMSTWHTSTSAYTKTGPGGGAMMGTSMASPVVAGAVGAAMGLYLRKNGSLPTPAQMETLLLTNAATSNALLPYVKNGKKLDLGALAAAISP